MSLTKRQAELLMFIYTSTQASGVAPSFEEMATALGIKAKSGIHRLIRSLALRGYLRLTKAHARAIEVLRLPAGTVSLECLAAENANMRDALIRARDALIAYEQPPRNALTAVLGALRRRSDTRTGAGRASAVGSVPAFPPSTSPAVT